MPLEIIRRKEGEISEKQQIRHRNTQFSINSYGHLVIREFDGTQTSLRCELEKCSETSRACLGCEHMKNFENPGEEHLIVLDQETTSKLIQFIFSIRNTYEYKEFLKEIIRKSCDLPF